MLMNTGAKPVASKNGLITTIGWGLGGKVTYCLEGSVFIAGAVVQWLRDGLKMIATAADIEKLAASVPDAGGVFLVPAFVGLGAPHWNQGARGTIVGLTRGTTAASTSPGRPRFDGLSDPRSARSHAAGFGHAARRAESRRRSGRQQSADAVPIRRAGRRRAAPRRAGNDGPRRRLPRRPGRRILERPGRRPPQLGPRSANSSRRWRRTSGNSSTRAGRKPSPARSIGRIRRPAIQRRERTAHCTALRRRFAAGIDGSPTTA